MNIRGIGTDIVSLARVRALAHTQRVAEYILLPDELRLFAASPDQAEYLGSRLAAKEAVIKAFPGELNYHDFSITKEGTKPGVTWRTEKAASCGIFLSIAHEFDNAVSFAVAYDRS